jgi:hypothetical protein
MFRYTAYTEKQTTHESDTVMRNMTQVTKGMLINTPHGQGFLSQVWPMQEGEKVDQCAYFVCLLRERDPKFGYPFYSAAELRALNPSIYFPAHRGEILRKN